MKLFSANGTRSVAEASDELAFRRRQQRQIWGFLTPGSIWMLMFFVLPMCVLISLTFRSFIDAQITDQFTFDNYTRVLTEFVYLKVFLRSLWIAIAVTVVTLIAGYPVAHFVARHTYKYRDLLFLALIIPFWTSIVIRTFAWKILLGNSGMVNYYLLQLGIIDVPVQFLFTHTAVVIGLVHVFLPFMIMPIYVSLEKLDASIEEAAMDLGANKVKTFLRVTLPLSLPGVAMGCLLVFILSLGSFLTPDLLGGTGSLMVSNVIQAEFLENGNWPFGGALSVVFLVVSLAFVVIYNHFFKFNDGDDAR